MRIILNTNFPTLNEYIKLERSSKFAAANLKKVTTNKISYLAKLPGCKLKENTCYNVYFTWHKPNNRVDHDNIAFAKKFILDGLVKGGVLENDSPKFINNFTDTFVLDKKRNYISCIVEFIEL